MGSKACHAGLDADCFIDEAKGRTSIKDSGNEGAVAVKIKEETGAEPVIHQVRQPCAPCPPWPVLSSFPLFCPFPPRPAPPCRALPGNALYCPALPCPALPCRS